MKWPFQPPEVTEEDMRVWKERELQSRRQGRALPPLSLPSPTVHAKPRRAEKRSVPVGVRFSLTYFRWA